MSAPRVAIVDCGLGNLYSVRRACVQAGLDAVVSDAREEIERAEGLVLPGVGAFGDAMTTLQRLQLVEPLRRAVAEGRPLLGVCLGMQLLMSQSREFGTHEGLGLVEGTVERFPDPRQDGRLLKVPSVGWNGIHPPPGRTAAEAWSGTPVEGLDAGTAMYFVHSYVVKPARADGVLTTTRYGDVEYCSGLRVGNVVAFQFHPERSGADGLRIYAGWARTLRASRSSGAQA